MNAKRIVTSLALAATALSLSLPAFSDYSAPSGWYLEGNYGLGHATDKSYGSGNSNSNDPRGFSIIVGRKYNPYAGLEFGYTRFSDIKVRDSSDTKVATDQKQVLHLAVKGFVPTKWGIEPFGKIGFARVISQVDIVAAAAAATAGVSSRDVSDNGMYFGAGFQYNYGPRGAFVAQWARAKGDSRTGTMDLYSVGLSYLFD